MMHLFSILHIILIVVMFVSAIILFLYFNKDELDEKLNVLKILSIVNLFLMIIRVFWIMIDKNYDYNLFDELILNPIDVICILAFIVYNLRKYQYISYLYYLGIIFSVLMILFPSEKYFGNIFAFRNLLYYINLYLNLIICIFTASTYDVEIKDIFSSIKDFFCFVVVCFCVNSLLGILTIHPTANYFYVSNPGNNMLFNLIYQLVPIGFVYYLVIILAIWILLYAQYGIHILLAKPIQKLKVYLNKDIKWYVKGGSIIKKEIE